MLMVDFLCYVLHYAIFFYLLTNVPIGQKWIFFWVFHLIVGALYIQLTLNHWQRPTKHSTEETDNWLVKQVVTSNNIDVTYLNEWFFGGLHYQIEHHLFPRMPRNYLSKVKPDILKLCDKYNIEYSSTGMFYALYEVLKNLKNVSHHSFEDNNKYNLNHKNKID
jgi:fatty acid desaturase